MLFLPLQFRPMDADSARSVLGWRYEEPYSMYNANVADLEEDIEYFFERPGQYYSVSDLRGNLLAFRCFGVDAQVPGGDYSAAALDTGGGMRPDLTGQGLGLTVLNAGLEFGKQTFKPAHFRVTVAAFNKRALAVCRRAGFVPVQTFPRGSDGMEFVVMIRDA